MSDVKLIHFNPKEEQTLASYARISTGKRFDDPKKDKEENLKLVRYIYRVKHLSVLEFADVTFQIECPIYVARQLMRYRTGSYIERSLRRCGPWKYESENLTFEESYYNESVDRYNALIQEGKPKEQARAALTLAAPTLYICKYNLRNVLHLFEERLTKATQKETREVVKMMYLQTANAFPVILEEFANANPCNVWDL